MIANVTRDPVYGCLLFHGKLDKDGYGLIATGCFYKRAHLVAWEQEVGPVPEGCELDHGCRRRNCVCIEHLEPVSRSVNQRRKAWRVRARMAKCKRGHDMSTNRVVTPEGGVCCRACVRGEK